MPLPSSYTELLFGDYLVNVLGEVASVLGWDAGSVQVLEATNDALLDLGLPDLATVTSARAFRGLRALGRRAIWRAVVQHVASRYDFSDSDAKFTRSQVQAMALEAMRLAESDCLEFNPNYAATIVRISRPQDPYIVLEDSARIP
jgi:hypothetical protein